MTRFPMLELIGVVGIEDVERAKQCPEFCAEFFRRQGLTLLLQQPEICKERLKNRVYVSQVIGILRGLVWLHRADLHNAPNALRITESVEDWNDAGIRVTKQVKFLDLEVAADVFDLVHIMETNLQTVLLE